MLLLAMGIFSLGSLACGIAQSLPQLIAARVVQGLGGAGLMTLSQALIGELIAPRERVRFQGYFAVVFTTASVAGPVLGGIVVSHLSWRWLFLANCRWRRLRRGACADCRAGRLIPVRRARTMCQGSYCSQSEQSAACIG